MRRIVFLTFVLLLAGAASLAAKTIPIVSGVTLEVNLPTQKWQMSRQAPGFLVLEMAEQLEHELSGKGKQAINAEAQKRLAVNELFIFNPDSGAVLTVDFSPLRAGEKAPDDRTVAASARYAGESLAGEEGFEGAESRTDRVKIAGAKYAHRVRVSFLRHGQPKTFTGIVGFVDPYWFFLYYTDPLRDPGDGEEMERMLESIALKMAKRN